MFKTVSLYVMVILYIGAGFNHFLHPGAYYPIIPDYLPWPVAINIASGIAEIVLGFLLLFKATRKAAAYGIIILLILFIPAHIFKIGQPGCLNPETCFPPWVSWVRLFPVQLLLIVWAWWHRK